MDSPLGHLAPAVTSSNRSNNISEEESQNTTKGQTNDTQVSNLTRNLLSSNNNKDVSVPIPYSYQAYSKRHSSQLESLHKTQDFSHNSFGNDSPYPPSYSASEVSTHNKFLSSSGPLNSFNNRFQQPFNSFQDQNTINSNNFNYRFANGSMNFIPSDHNTPTMVSSSYTSNPSHTSSLHNISRTSSTNNFAPVYNHIPNYSSSYKPTGLNSGHAIPTTNVSMDSAKSNASNSIHDRSHYASEALPKSAHTFGDGPPHDSSLPQTVPLHIQSMRGSTNLTDQSTISHSSFPQMSSCQTSSTKPLQSESMPINLEPDHYMTYKEFLNNLNMESETTSRENQTEPEEHLNIVNYSVNDLITMLACLLTKIIEANDKLHPNHFDNTIAVRQQLKEGKRTKKFQRLEASRNADGLEVSSFLVDGDDELSDEEEDEKKNKYLANVLAFHGKNIPGISLQAYLARILKYCPVTNEVFLSLLVYFDRIAKKANNLKNNEDKVPDEIPEQLFVMGSYNIHRLIIAGITVSSKFFSDIFYKNLRYAKVGGLPLEELNYLELQFLLLLDFKLMITVEDLQNYGDLLLRFWKREQVTNELVNPEGMKE